jgi:micrococcal nuclease
MLTFIVSAALIVVAVHDGDTLTVADGPQQTTIRLAEIDAPERTQPYSQVSRRNLQALCKDAKRIEVETVGTDRYGRTVAHVHCDGVHASWRQVENGLAWCFIKYLDSPAECLPREQDARNANRGLWRDPNPVAPWLFRESKRGSLATP